MKTSLTIKRRPSEQANRFSLLREKGLAEIQALAGKRWTDFNLHDPGVTLLEQLCFSLSELDYKLDMPIADLLCDKRGQIDTRLLGLEPPEAILPCRPTTLEDYRCLLLDALPELADIELRPQSDVDAGSPIGLFQARAVLRDPGQSEEAMAKRLRQCFGANRNLGEDLGDIHFVHPYQCQIVAELDIQSNVDPSSLVAQLYLTCEALLTRSTASTPYSQLLAEGITPERLFEGPLTPRGKLDRDKLSENAPEVGDFILPIQNLSGVQSLGQFYLLVDSQPCHHSLPQDAMRNVYTLVLPSQPDDLKIRMQIGNKTVSANLESVLHFYEQQKMKRSQGPATIDFRHWLPVPKGQYRSVSQYHSIQALLPANYLMLDIPDKKHNPQHYSQILQLKGYLLVFEQLLSDALAQLSHLPSLFSPQSLEQSYYNHALKDEQFAGLSELVQQDYAEDLGALTARLDNHIARKHRLLDYLLALYGESFNQHSLRHYDYQGKIHAATRQLHNKVRFLADIVQLGRDRIGALDYHQNVWREPPCGFVRKVSLLLDLGAMGGSMTLPFLQQRLKLLPRDDRELLYLEETDKLQTVPYVQLPGSMNSQTLATKLRHALCFRGNRLPQDVLLSGIRLENYRIGQHTSGYQLLLLPKPDAPYDWYLVGHFQSRRAAVLMANCLVHFLVQLNQQSEGLHVIEHLLLKNPKAKDNVLPDSFFSGRISLFMPDWTVRFVDEGFKALAMETVLLSCPAHLRADLYFLDFEQMYQLEKRYKYWRSAKKLALAGQGDCAPQARHLADLVARYSGDLPEHADA
ncbi:hypothetical protein P2G88_02865 [Aliiglaciecola sp. CAU 1673]|uniref:hypothetical protein n=1 Tax=Aliiglaciecola sp. CAU 1673 TaxID=3032595 RepID=UPI0023DA5540|nr:hypothetical protein [Aliiglaciecola sp. CAU 1673]MDF2177185.1 hypothetical protein [Aliiglaciecola sp. CAU 1673]